MSISNLADAFDHTTILGFRYWYEQHVFTAYDPALPTGTEELFNLSDVLKDTGNQQMALLSGLAVTNTANVSLNMHINRESYTLPTVGFPPGLLGDTDQTYRGLGRLGVSWANNTGATLSTPQQANYYGALKTLTTADKVLYQLPSSLLTPTDQEYIKKYNIRGQGLRPLTLTETLAHAFGRAVVQEEIRSYVLNIGTTTQYVGPFETRPDEIIVIRSLSAAPPYGSVGNLMQWSWSRDNQDRYITLLLDNACGLACGWSVWITAKHSFGFTVKAETATNNVPVQIRWWRVRYTTLLRALLGDLPAKSLSKEDQHLLEQVEAGIIV